MEMEFSPPPPVSTLSGIKIVDYTKHVIQIFGPRLQRTLSPRLFGQVQDVWAYTNAAYGSLRSRYRSEMARKRLRIQELNNMLPQLPSEWIPQTGSPLTTEQKLFLQMSPSISTFTKCTINGRRNEFRTMNSELNNKTDNSCFKVWYNEEDERHNSVLTPSFGWIQDMFTHELYQNGP